MSSYRRRGAHASAGVSAAPFAPPKRAAAPPNGARPPARSGAARKRPARSRPPILRVIIAALVVGFGAVGFAGGLWAEPSAEPTVQAFLLDWQDGSLAGAAALTTGAPAAVASGLRNAYRRLGAAAFHLSMGPIKQHGNTAVAEFTVSVDLGQNGAPWVYVGRMALKDPGSGWKIAWSPSVINPALRPGLHLGMVSTTPRRKPLLDDTGHPLQTPSLAWVAGVRPGKLKDPWATAMALGAVTKLEPTELLGWMQVAPRNPFEELVVLRPDQYHRLAHKLNQVPGLIVKPEHLRLFTSIAPAVAGSVGTEVSGELRNRGIAYRPGATVGLSGLQQAYQIKLAGAPTTQVITETPAGHQVQVLKTWNGSPPAPVRTTIDSAVQNAATSAVTAARGSAAVVAVQASTGRILAVAEHKAKGLPRVDPLAGQYPPGTAFTIVSTEALLATGLPVTSPIRCIKVNNVGGKNFRNVPPVPNLGPQPQFAADFAHACATAFVGLSVRPDVGHLLTGAAQGFGLGGPWRLPLPGFSGSVGPASSAAQVAANTVGLGSVKVSPLAMALVAGEVATGARHTPSLVNTPGADPHSQQAPFPASRLAALRNLMRSTVISGAASAANLAGQPVYGQVGTAALGSGKHHKWVNWFVGYRGGIAFAVVQITALPAVSAVQPGASFLTAAPQR
jgi:transpeptidase family protein/MecA-like transpeptidase family protein/penicillin-binding protein